MGNLGDRMKSYENVDRNYLTRRVPVIIRLDGQSFHSYTKGCTKPFDKDIIFSMAQTTKMLCENLQGVKAAYTQSDEITLLLTDYDTIKTEAWFNYNTNKMTSISAAIASVTFTEAYRKRKNDCFKPAFFDSRAFNIPKEEVINNFRWRYKDWLRNSIQMLAQSLYSQKQLHGKKTPQLHEMCFQKGHNWNDLDPRYKNGTLFIREEKGFSEYTEFNLMSEEWLSKINELVGLYKKEKVDEN